MNTFTSDEPSVWNVVVNYKAKPRRGASTALSTSWYFDDRGEAFAKAEELVRGDEATFLEVYRPVSVTSVEVVEKRVHARWAL